MWRQIYDGERGGGVVEPAVWQSVRDRLRSNARRGGREVRIKNGALLKGILKCASGQTGMTHLHAEKRQQALPLLHLRHGLSKRL